MKFNNKKNYLLVVLIFLIAVVGYLFYYFYMLDKYVPKEPPKEVLFERASKNMTDGEKEILRKISDAIYKKGLYTYRYDFPNDTVYLYQFVSGDKRTLYKDDDGIYILYDGKYKYLISDNTKKYNVKELNDKTISDSAPTDKNIIRYDRFYDDEGKRISGLKIYEDSSYYVIETENDISKYNKDGILVEETGKSGGEKYVRKLVGYDEDFDKYYDEVLAKIDEYQKVDSTSEVSPK